jgi:hypothetical protein
MSSLIGGIIPFLFKMIFSHLALITSFFIALSYQISFIALCRRIRSLSDDLHHRRVIGFMTFIEPPLLGFSGDHHHYSFDLALPIVVPGVFY